MMERETDTMTARLTTLVDGALHDADMQVKMPKTFSQHVFKRDTAKVSHAEAVATQQKYKKECQFCGRRFKTTQAVRIHEAKCIYSYNATEEYFTVEKIVGVFGRLGQRWFLVKFEGYPKPEWQRGRLLEQDGCHESIRSFRDRSGLSPCKELYEDPEGLNRCDVCGKVYK